MSQHDYDLANQAGSAFRADLNRALAAIVSQNSGPTAPSTTFAYQWWADTTTGLLKIRNAANNAWITIGTLADANLGLLSTAGGTLTGALLADDAGTAALPAIAFDGDPTTGIFRAGADQLGIATNGVDTEMFNPQNVKVDARESLGIARDDFLVAYFGTTGMAHGLETMEGRGHVDSSNCDDVTRATFASVHSLGNNVHGAWHVADGHLI